MSVCTEVPVCSVCVAASVFSKLSSPSSVKVCHSTCSNSSVTLVTAIVTSSIHRCHSSSERSGASPSPNITNPSANIVTTFAALTSHGKVPSLFSSCTCISNSLSVISVVSVLRTFAITWIPFMSTPATIPTTTQPLIGVLLMTHIPLMCSICPGDFGVARADRGVPLGRRLLLSVFAGVGVPRLCDAVGAGVPCPRASSVPAYFCWTCASSACSRASSREYSCVRAVALSSATRFSSVRTVFIRASSA